MTNVENSASARLSATGVWLERGEGLARVAAGAVRGMSSWLRWGLSSLGRVQARRAALRNLHALDDRLLQDIGLRRDQVAEVVDGMFRRESVEAATRPTRTVATGSADAITEVNASNDGHYQSAA